MATLYFEYKTELYPQDVDRRPNDNCTTLAWSNIDPAIMAVATSMSGVSLFLEEGDKLDGENNVITHGVHSCNSLKWHPKQAILACGWADGAITLWYEKDRTTKESLAGHSSAVNYITWSPDGSRLISGDASGALTVWDVDPRHSKLKVHAQYTRKGAVRQLVFRAPSNGAHLEACPSFFYGCEDGVVYFADDAGHCSEVVSIGTPVNFLHYSHAKDYLVILSLDAVLSKYRIQSDGKMIQDRRAKLSIKGDGSEMQCVYAGAGLLAAANHEPMVRVWHLETDDNYTLPITDARHMTAAKDLVRCVSFNHRKRILAAGTQFGKVCLWKYVGPPPGKATSAEDWEILPPVDAHDNVAHLSWSNSDIGLMGLMTTGSASVLAETVLNTRRREGNTVIQMSTDLLYVMQEDMPSQKVTAGFRVKGIDVSDRTLICWNGKQVEVREFKGGQVRVTSSFKSKARACAVIGETVFCAVGNKIELCNFQGIVKSSLIFSDEEGVPLALHIHKAHMAVFTSGGYIKLWEVTRRDPKTVVPSRIFEGAENPGIIKSISVNCSGTKISLLTMRPDDSGIMSPDTRVYVYDVELDKLFSFDFGPKFFPVAHTWDSEHAQLLAVETHRISLEKPAEEELDPEGQEAKEDNFNPFQAEPDEEEAQNVKVKNRDDAEAVTLFATSEYGILMQDSFIINLGVDSLMALSVPHVLFLGPAGQDSEADSAGVQQQLGVPRIRKRAMRDFVGMEQADKQTKQDLMEFSYHLTVGNMDDAYRAVKKIKSNTIWENMAKMCVKTKRMDVAETCLGNMANARGAKAVREAKKEPEKEAQVAMVAIQLGMIEDAERLYKECGRYDLLVQLYKACGRWKDALKVCSKYCRIQLKTTHYKYARYLEETGDIGGAVYHYEKSETHRREVPRMLYNLQQLTELEQYVGMTQDSKLIQWWAEYAESVENFPEAMKFYHQANDVNGEVKVLCHLGELERAEELCNETNDLAACYRLARFYEKNDNIKKAVEFFKLAKRFNHGIRIAKEAGLDTEVMMLALESSDLNCKTAAARYFEAKGLYDKAVLLYTKGKKVAKALDLCFKGNLFDALRDISDDLSSETDPKLLAKCGEFFMSHNQFDKAVHLFLSGGNYTQALDLCVRHNIPMTEEMAEKMTPPKVDDPSGKAARIEALKRIAQCCKDQGIYDVACKKYTQANEKVKAMRCLLKTNDSDKIIYYATMTKMKEVYVLAANFLQNLDWHNEPEVMKTIISFYSKAHAWQPLASFYDAFASVEIDEYRDYEKALGALKESRKYVVKNAAESKLSEREQQDRLLSLDNKIHTVQQFVDARKNIKSNPVETVAVCNQLLDNAKPGGTLRTGDIYALLIEHFYSMRQFTQAYDYITRMQEAGIVIAPYLDSGMVKNIYEGAGVAMPSAGGSSADEIDEEIN